MIVFTNLMSTENTRAIWKCRSKISKFNYRILNNSVSRFEDINTLIYNEKGWSTCNFMLFIYIMRVISLCMEVISSVLNSFILLLFPKSTWAFQWVSNIFCINFDIVFWICFFLILNNIKKVVDLLGSYCLIFQFPPLMQLYMLMTKNNINSS